MGVLSTEVEWWSAMLTDGATFTGNSWGECGEGKDGEEGQLGCGPQEIFRNCADVAIVTNTAGFPPMPEVRRRKGEPEVEGSLSNNDIFDLVPDEDKIGDE